MVTPACLPCHARLAYSKEHQNVTQLSSTLTWMTCRSSIAARRQGQAMAQQQHHLLQSDTKQVCADLHDVTLLFLQYSQKLDFLWTFVKPHKRFVKSNLCSRLEPQGKSSNTAVRQCRPQDETYRCHCPRSMPVHQGR